MCIKGRTALRKMRADTIITLEHVPACLSDPQLYSQSLRSLYTMRFITPIALLLAAVTALPLDRQSCFRESLKAVVF
jgi:hypothetical protein